MAESEWTLNTLKEYILGIIEERDKRHEQRFLSQEKAVLKSEESQREYNAKSNEFRQSLDDSNKIKIDRTEVQKMVEAVHEKIDTVKIDSLKITDELKKDISTIRETLSKDVGKDQSILENKGQRNWGTQVIIAIALSLLSLVVTVGMFLITYFRR